MGKLNWVKMIANEERKHLTAFAPDAINDFRRLPYSYRQVSESD